MSTQTPLYLNTILTFRLARVQAKLNAQGARILKETAGLSLAQWRILMLLAADGPSTSTEIGRKAQTDKGLLSRKLKLLIEDGLVTAEPHPTDRRVQVLSMSDAGRALFEATLPHMQARQDWLRALLSGDEIAALLDTLDKIEAGLDDTSHSEAAE